MSPISCIAAEIVAYYAYEVSDSREWPNETNVKRTRQVLFAYISALEQSMKNKDPQGFAELQRSTKPAKCSFTGGGL